MSLISQERLAEIEHKLDCAYDAGLDNEAKPIAEIADELLSALFVAQAEVKRLRWGLATARGALYSNDEESRLAAISQTSYEALGIDPGDGEWSPP